MSYLFGSILAIKFSEMVLSIILAIVVILVIVLFYHELVYIAFDEESAKVSGIKVNFLNALLIFLTAITIVSSMRVIGLLLASSLMIIPASSSLLLKKDFKTTLLFSVLFSILSVIFGLIIAYMFDFSVSGTIVLLNVGIFVSILLFRSLFKKKQQFL
jgi:zinc transport system permease protein